MGRCVVEFPLIQIVSFHLERFVMNKLLMALASLAASLVLVGCAAPFPYQTGNVQGCYRNNNGLTICSGGTGSNVPQGVYQQQQPVVVQQQAPVIIQQQGFGGQLAPGMSCPGNSQWDGRGCRISGYSGGNVYPRQQRMCENPKAFVNGGWQSRGYFPC